MPKEKQVNVKVIPFNFKSRKVRTVQQKHGGIWFVVKDVCKILGLSNPTEAIEKLDKDERSKFYLGRQGEGNIINESGLYTLILRSNKPEAKPFRKWVTSEVLPAIRKTGSYSVNGLTPEQQRTIQNLVKERAYLVANGKKPDKGIFMSIYRDIKDTFKVAKYSQVPKERFPDLVRFLGGKSDTPKGEINNELTPEHHRIIQNIVLEKAYLMAGGKKPDADIFMRIYRSINDKFNVDGYNKVPDNRYYELVEFLGANPDMLDLKYISSAEPKKRESSRMTFCTGRLTQSLDIMFPEYTIKQKIKWNELPMPG